MQKPMESAAKAEKQKKPVSTRAMVALGFLLIITAVTVLLMLPISSRDGKMTDPLTALFTATSATCVTGLVMVDTVSHFSPFGQVVLLVAIQIGGLGVMTMLSVISLMLGRRIGLRQRTLLMESVASLHIGGIVHLIRHAFFGTAIIEGLGALLLSFRFVPLFGWGRGIWYSVFHSVSAFCNGGFDLMGHYSGAFSSLEGFVSDPLVTLTAVALISVGALGFFVWDDLLENRFVWRKLQLHSRAAIQLSVFMLLIPAGLFFVFERHAGMEGMPLGTRILASLFASATPRTAGFDTIPLGNYSAAGSTLTMILMLAGGNPGSTAGGAKTTTLLLVVLLAISTLRGEEEVHIMGRRMENDLVRRACAIVVVYVGAALCATMAICAIQPEFPVKDVLLEVFSAIDTVGMTTGITRAMKPVCQVILILLMFAGRLGSMTFALLITKKVAGANIRYPVDRLIVG